MSKTCKDCGGVFAITPEFFYYKRTTNPSTGTVSTYAENRCKACSNFWRYQAYRAKNPPVISTRPALHTSRHWPRPDHETACDTAFMGWPTVEPAARVVAL